MTLEEAIDLLKELGDGVSLPDMQNYQDACKLGIEAMTMIRDARVARRSMLPVLLPGETKD